MSALPAIVRAHNLAVACAELLEWRNRMTIEVKAHHRRILDLAAEDNPTNARVDSYKKSVGYQESLAQGWIEELQKPAGNGFYFRITPTGTEARYRPKLKMLPPRKPLAMVTKSG